MGYTLATARARFGHRAAVVASDRDQFVPGRTALAGRGARPDLVRGVTDAAKAVFVFPSQGSQWAGMARELLGSPSSDAFSATVAECAAALQEFVDWSVRDVLEGAPGAPSLGRIDVAQPALFTMMVSLSALWRSYGVEPAAVVGHSQGEIAAAYVAGGLSLRDAARVVARGSRAWLTLSGQGGMASVSLPIEEVYSHLECWGDRLGIAAVDGPASVTVAGDPEALDALITELTAAGVRSRRIPGVDTARHCGQVDVLRERLLRELAPVTPTPSRIPFYSSVTGGQFDTAGLDTAYWYRNMREPVLFERATRALVAHGHRCIIEVSPHPVLVAAVQETAQDAGTDVSVIGTLHRGDGGYTRMLASLAEAHSHGVPVAGRETMLAGRGARQVGLPAHTFDRQRYRPDPPLVRSEARNEVRSEAGNEGRGEAGNEGRGDTRGDAQGETRGEMQGAGVPSGSLVRTLFARAYRLGKANEYMETLANLGRFVPRFDQPSELDDARNLVQLALGPATPRLVCLPSLAGQSGPHQFAEFAAGMRDTRDVTVSPHPGFVSGEPLAANADALTRAHAEAVLHGTRGAPFALVGYSSGGWVGHAVAELLEASGVFPAAVVLIDTYPPGSKPTGELWPEVLGRMATGHGRSRTGEEASLTATAVHMNLFDGWRPGTLVAPTLLVRASERPVSSAGGDRRAHWPVRHAAVEVPGDHFTMMEEHASSTARAVHEWLLGLGS